MSKLRFYILSIGILLLASTAMSDTIETIFIKLLACFFSNATWDVEIFPQTLAVNAYPEGTDITVRISSEQTGLEHCDGFF